MKIKLAILEKDINYLSRIVSVFGTKYADNLEIYSFSDEKVALSTLETSRIDVFLASDVFEIDINWLPKRCGFGYLVDSADIDTVNDQRVICKFQKIDLIYKQILDIYSENATSITGIRTEDDNCKTIGFIGLSGGVGSSTMAAAMALRMAAHGKKVLYLNLEKYGSSDVFFKGEGQFDMSDIIFAIKRKKANLSMKLESCVKQDDRGVYFFSQSKIALDMMELSAEEILHLLKTLKLNGSYDMIILDMDFSLEQENLDIYRRLSSVVVVGDGTEISNVKMYRTLNALKIIEQNREFSLLGRMQIVYNKFSNKMCKTLENMEIQEIGGAPRYEHATTQRILQQLVQMEMFDKIM